MRSGSRQLSRIGALALGATLVLLVAGSGVAGVNEWSSTGPVGGLVTGVAVDPGDPSTIFVSTNGGGIFKSVDSGGTWEAANNGQNYLGISALAMAPSDPDTLYSVSVLSGVYRTTNGGDLWVSRHSGITASASGIYELAVNPTDADTVYAATQAGVFKTMDGGGDWDLVGSVASGLANVDVTAIAIDPATPTTVFAASFISGPLGRSPVYVSTNSGTSWTEVNLAPNEGPKGFANDLEIDAATPATMYAGTAGTGLWKTANSGANWTQIAKSDTPGVLTNAISGVTVDPSDSTRLYVATPFGFSVSENSGTTWALNNPLIDNLALGVNTNGTVLAVDPDTPENVYGGTSVFGMLKSVDSGDAWTEANAGLIASSVFGLGVSPSDPRTVYAALDNKGLGVMKSTDGGASWSRTKFASSGRGVAVHPTDPGTVLLATASGMFRTTDGGMATPWTAVNTGLPGTPPNLFGVAFDPANPLTAYAGTLSNGIYKSTNGGSSWTFKSSGLPGLPPLIRSFAFDPTNTSTVYAATNNGVYKSVDGGENWLPKFDGSVLTGVINGIAVDPTTPTTLYAGKFGGSGLFKSEDGADNWVVANTGLTDFGVTGLVLDPADPDILYVSTNGGPGLFRSDDGAETWTELNNGLATTLVSALALGSLEGSFLYAGTSGGGVFTYIADAVAPTNPDLDPSHTPSVWSNDPSIDMGLSGAEDLASGVDGYAYEWDTSAGSTLDPAVKAIEETATSVASGDLADGDSHYFHLRTVDNAGNWSAVVTEGPFFIDTTPPTDVTLTGAALNRAFQLARQFPVSWTGQDAMSGIDSYTREKRVNNGPWVASAPTSGTGPTNVSGALGQTLCLRVTALDGADNATTSDARCTSIPFNNKQLIHSRGWTKKTGASYYQNTYSATAKKGTSLKKTLVDVEEIGLVVTKCRGCGTLAVYWKGQRIATVRLAASRTRKKQIVKVADFALPEDGVLRLVVTTAGRTVKVEGLGVLRAPN